MVVLDHRDWDAFGNLVNETSSANTDRFEWTGREFDSETGLQYNRAREYSPAVDRWVSEDPLGFRAGDPDLYRYVANLPTTIGDSSGLESGEFDGGTTNFNGIPYLNKIFLLIGRSSFDFPRKGNLERPGFIIQGASDAANADKELEGWTMNYGLFQGLDVLVKAIINKEDDAKNYYWHQTIEWSYTTAKPFTAAEQAKEAKVLLTMPKGAKVDPTPDAEKLPKSRVTGAEVWFVDKPGFATSLRTVTKGEMTPNEENLSFTRPTDMDKYSLVDFYGAHGVTVTAKLVSTLKCKTPDGVNVKGSWTWGFKVTFPMGEGKTYAPYVAKEPKMAVWKKGA